MAGMCRENLDVHEVKNLDHDHGQPEAKCSQGLHQKPCSLLATALNLKISEAIGWRALGPAGLKEAPLSRPLFRSI